MTLTLKEAKERVSKEAVEQFEEVRASGVTNMLMRSTVQDLGGDELAALTREEYTALIIYYPMLMEHYDIERS